MPYLYVGEVAALMAHTLGVECVLTGHSLGRNKREHLLKSGISANFASASFPLCRILYCVFACG